MTHTWPPNFTLKKHHQARHVKLKASSHRGLEIIVPLRFNQKNIPDILEKNRTWIEKQLEKIGLQKKEPDILPSKITFHAINQTWDIHYIATSNKLRILKRPHQALALVGNIEDKALCKATLLAWIKQQAKKHLLSHLDVISQETQLSYKKSTVRSQISRWGSCSSKKIINLNYKLLFLPFNLMKHIMIHELCHTVHLNHSEKFWQLVEKFDPDWKAHRRALKNIELNTL